MSVKGVTELVDLEVENVDRPLKCWVAPISVHGLLIRFVGFVAFWPAMQARPSKYQL
jgi:hypothetical protein